MKYNTQILVILTLILLIMPVNTLLSQEKTNTKSAANTKTALIDESQIPLDSAVADTAGNTKETPRATVSIWDYIRVIIILLLVIGCIYLIFYFIKKSSKPRLPENQIINVLSSSRLQGNTSLHIVEAGTSIFLIGTGDGSVTLVSEITDKESVDTIRLKASTIEKEKKVSFPEILANILKPGTKEKIKTDDNVKFIKDQKDRLKMM